MLGKQKDKIISNNSIKFPTVLMLLKWLHTKFTKYWKSGQGHDLIDVQYTVLNKNGSLQQKRFSIIYLYLSKMDIWTRIELNNILLNINVKRKNLEKRHTILADCLHEYFHKNIIWNVWICFRIPIYLQSTNNIVYDMLQMATGAYNNTHTIKNQIDNDDKITTSESVIDLSARIKDDKESEMKKSVLKKVDMDYLRDSFIERYHAGVMSPTESSVDRLSYWYQKIDEQYDEVIRTMKEYYIQKFKNNLTKVNNQINGFALTLTECNDNKSNSSKNAMKFTNMKHLRNYRETFMNAFESFRKIKERCMCSNKYYLIEAYHKTKSCQIYQMERKLLGIFLKNCQQDLSTKLNEKLKFLSKPEFNLKKSY